MPYGRGRTVSTYRKTFRRSSKGYKARKAGNTKGFKSKYRSVVKYNPRGSIFGKQYFAKLKYQTLVELSTISSVMVFHTFKLNSLYDPDDTGVGGQPLMYDTLCGNTVTTAPFSNYRVCGAKIKAYLVNDNSSGTTSGAFFIHWRYGLAGTLDSISELGEQPNTIVTDIGVTNSSKGIKCLSKYVSMKKMMGIKDLKDDDNTAGAYNADPAKIVRCDIGWQPYNSAVTSDVFVRVKITYYAQFFSQNEMLQS